MLDLYLLRPPIVLGPHAVGAKDIMAGPAAAVGKRLFELVRRLPVPLPALAPDMPVQFIHEDDVGQAFLQCVVAAGPLGAYNIAADGVLTDGLVHAAADAIAGLPKVPGLPPATEWVEAPATRRSWTPPRRRRSWAGSRATTPWRRCAGPCLPRRGGLRRARAPGY